MDHSLAMFILLVMAPAWSSFFLVADARPGDVAGGSCIPRERDALLAFKQGIDEETQDYLGSWQHGHHDCCRWAGITCSDTTGHVIKLDLNGTDLLGQISPSLLSLENLEYLTLHFSSWCNPDYGVPEFLGSLKKLRHLDLSFLFCFVRVPSQLGNLSKLEYLRLQFLYTCLPDGDVPVFLGSLKNLRHLDLSFMICSGALSPLGNLSKLEYLSLTSSGMHLTYISWLTRLPLLAHLDMSSFDLGSIVDWPLAVNMIPSLEYLRLFDCSLPKPNRPLTHINLTNLEHLDLSNNYFRHTVASNWFWNATSIKYLDLSGNSLYGPFPNALGNMTSLRELYFDQQSPAIVNTATMTVDLKNLCHLKILRLDGGLSTGNITDFIEKLPQHASNRLQELSLSRNNMFGMLPKRMGQFATLSRLDLSHNNITGAIPLGIENCTALNYLDLSDNHLTGVIPPWLENCTHLSWVSLSSNNLSGAIQLSKANFSYLEYLDLSDNHLSGAIPPWLVNCTSLSNLSLSSNYLTGPIPLGIMSHTTSYLDISNNLLTGAIPQNMGNCTSLQYISLSRNHLTGPIPQEIASCTELSMITLSNNHLTGQVPSKFGMLSNLMELDLSNNNLNGLITKEHMVNLKNLEHMDLSHNYFSGPLPSELGVQRVVELTLASNYFIGHIPKSVCQLQDLLVLDLSNNFIMGELPQCSKKSNLAFLLLSNNSFSGKFPSSLRTYPSLAFVDLSKNNFHGTLPSWIGDLVYLRFLQLSHNLLDGDIPMTITSIKRLRYLSLAGNSISGVIPWSLSNLTAMAQIHPMKLGAGLFEWYNTYVGKFREVWPVVMKRQELKYGAGIFDMVSIDLSLNHLVGRIPDGATSLSGLLNLNLSWNHLNGSIPANIGAMKSMESLDLSRNNLTGEIPSSLSDLTYLSSLDLSYNNFVGRIPPGAQLDTLYMENPSIYNGNIGLCGPPLERNCSGDNVPENVNRPRRGKVSRPVLFFYFGLGSGFVAGLWVVFCTLLFKKAWRVAYFRLFDKLYDNAYVFVVVNWGWINGKATTS